MKKRKKMLLAGFVFLFVFSFFYLAANTTKAQKEKKEEKELVMGIALHPLIPNTSMAGKGMADVREFFQFIADEAKKLFGYTVTLKIYPAPKFLFKAFQDKTVDCAASNFHYLYAKNHGISVTPFATVSATEKKGTLHCVYVRKDSGIKNMGDLKGKKFVINFPDFLSRKDALPYKESYIDWVIAKKILAKNGITVPFKDFFKEFKVLPAPWESVSYSVMIKIFDACVVSTFFNQSLTNYDPGFSDLVPLPHSCISIPAEAPLFCRNSLDVQMLQKLKMYILSPPKGSQAEKILKKEFKGLKPVLVNEKDYTIYFQWLKEAEQKGWIDEFNDIMKNTPLPKRKGRVK